MQVHADPVELIDDEAGQQTVKEVFEVKLVIPVVHEQ